MQSVFDSLEWPAIQAHLASLCQTPMGVRCIDGEDFLTSDVAAIRQTMGYVEEAKTLILRYSDVTIAPHDDLQGLFHRLEKQGVIETPVQLGQCLHTLKQLRQLCRYVIQHRSKEDTPTLIPVIEAIVLPNAVIERLETIVTDTGEMVDTASEEYQRLKKRVDVTKQQAQETLHGLMNQPHFAKYLQEPIVTQREGRWVLPVRVEEKAHVKGVVHDTSASGATVYIEPHAVLDLNNQLLTLEKELEREIQRILKVVSEELTESLEELSQFVGHATQVDVLMAKARQSLALDANPVAVEEKLGQLNLRGARHPLLVLQLDDVVANDIVLQPPHRVMVITGSNTGGKTVLLKLLGLFALMVQAGLHLPVKPGSTMSLFTPVLADIGDAQSILQSLSTFSGHMARLTMFLEQPDLSQALVLVDEVCAGTDPQEGAALAKALIEAFESKGATVVVTTHIGELKVLAHERDVYLNASVEFDPKTLTPTYRLILGVPGASHAIHVAQQLGVPEGIITNANTYLSQPASDAGHLIESLETRNRELSVELDQAKQLREDIQWEEQQLAKQLNRIEGEKKKSLELYRQGIQEKLWFIDRELNDLKKELRTLEKHPEKLGEVMQNFKHVSQEAQGMFYEESQKLYPSPTVNWQDVAVGDVVASRSLNLSGTVVDKNERKQEITLEAGILKTTVAFEDITRVEGRPEKKMAKKKPRSQVPQKKRQVTVDCDVRGMTAEEAIGVLEKVLDDALLSEAQMVHVIHGKGTGALKKAVRAHLKDLSYIKSFVSADPHDGGEGKTVITL